MTFPQRWPKIYQTNGRKKVGTKYNIRQNYIKDGKTLSKIKNNIS